MLCTIGALLPQALELVAQSGQIRWRPQIQRLIRRTIPAKHHHLFPTEHPLSGRPNKPNRHLFALILYKYSLLRGGYLVIYRHNVYHRGKGQLPPLPFRRNANHAMYEYRSSKSRMRFASGPRRQWFPERTFNIFYTDGQDAEEQKHILSFGYDHGGGFSINRSWSLTI